MSSSELVKKPSHLVKPGLPAKSRGITLTTLEPTTAGRSKSSRKGRPPSESSTVNVPPSDVARQLEMKTQEGVHRGILTGIDQGDSLSDVLRYWSEICLHPTRLFKTPENWEFKSMSLDTGVTTIYANFLEFIDRERKKQQAVDRRVLNEGIELREKTGTSYAEAMSESDDSDDNSMSDDCGLDKSHLRPLPPSTLSSTIIAASLAAHGPGGPNGTNGNADDDADDDACWEEELTNNQLIMPTTISGNSKSARTSQQSFWDITRLLIPGMRKQSARVSLPSRYDTTECLRRFSQKVHAATSDIRLKLQEVPTAYNDARHHTLYLVITPHMRKSSSLADCLFVFYDITEQGGIYNAHSKKVTARYAELAFLHPMFGQECWRDLFFKVSALASYKCIFINFNFHVGLHHQYLDVFEQDFELVRHQEVETVGGMTTGAITSFFKNAVEEEDHEAGRMTQWIYEFDIPDEYHSSVASSSTTLTNTTGGQIKHISSAIPTYKGMRVRFMFREDHAAWFF